MTRSLQYRGSFSSLVSLLVILFVFSELASAHARWSLTGLVQPRTASTGLKEPFPCGGVARTVTPKVLKSGDTLVVEFEETINHPGHFRIAFSSANEEGFDQNVLVDNIPEVPATLIYPQTITLPNIECTDCTLQLIQVMTDRTPPTNYYSCADIQLTLTGAPPPGGDITPPSDIANLLISAGDTQANLSWTNPAIDFFQTLMLQGTNAINAIPIGTTVYNVGDVIGNANVIYAANGTSYTAPGLVNGGTYFFKLYAYNAGLNYASGVEITTTLPAIPVNGPPSISLIAEQSQKITTSVLKNANNVIVQATVNDPNPSDTHSYNWSATDSRLVDVDTAANNFTFDPVNLDPGFYSIQVKVTDDGTPAQSSTAILSLQVVTSSSSKISGGSVNPLTLLFCFLLAVTIKSRRYFARYFNI